MALPVRRSRDDRPAPVPPGIAGWDPFDDIERLTGQLSSYLESWKQLPSLLGEAFTPPADVEETDDACVVEIELPGIKRDDLDIEVAGRLVIVHGQRKEKERVGILRRRERIVSRFHHEVTLPGDVAEDGVQAHLDVGVLSLRLPKPEAEWPRRIQIR
ncbi:MAG TPA: Hsp20/alpha crystallin family protein [Acidimicrobiales bacterium]|nr:Hsp20/alpha crystallin family protein [Acidimicrobiales bacterium]